MLPGVVATIQIFVYPSHWAEHPMWVCLPPLIFARGAGTLSADVLGDRFVRRRR